MCDRLDEYRGEDMRRSLSLCTFLVAAACGLVPASAHEGTKVGSFSFVVGWGDEPAYSGFKNSVQLILVDERTEKPVTDLTETLKVDVKSGSETMTLALEPNFELGEFGEPGDYRAWLIPTRPGTYSFRFYGTVHGAKIDKTFTSGETTFDNVVDPQGVQFPAQDPTNQQLNDKLDRGLARAQLAAKKANDKATTTTIPAWIGVGLGALALVVAVVGRKKAQ